MSTKEYPNQFDPGPRQAVQELTAMIEARHPSAEFLVEPGIDDPEATHIIAIVDLDDPDEAMDLVIDRLVELQVEAGLPISVIPIRAPERIAALVRARRKTDRSEALLPPAQI